MIPTWDFCLTAAWILLWPVALQMVFEVEADRERVELGKGAQDAANELHARHVGEHVAHAQYAEAAFRVAGQGPEPREDAGDVGVQAWNSICTEKYQLCVYRHQHAELELQRRQPESKAKLTDRFIHTSLSYTVCMGDGDLALPSARSEGRLSTKTEAVLGQRDPVLSFKSSHSLNISPNTFLKMGPQYSYNPLPVKINRG